MSASYARVFLFVLAMISTVGNADSARYSNVIDLAGDWVVRAVDGEVRQIRLPNSLESQIRSLRWHSGRVVYQREFPVPESWQGRLVTLKFGAVDWLAEVSVNGKPVGVHEGGYTPFEFDITDAVNIGAWNDLQIAVTDAAPGRPASTLVFDEIPHGNQARLGSQSGIWQFVRLEAVEPVTVVRVRVTPDLERSTAVIEATLNRPSEQGELGVLVIGAGALPRTTIIPLSADQSSYETEIKLSEPRLWEPESPYLYKAQAHVRIDGVKTDPVVVEFGMRKIEVKDSRIFLNNRPIFVNGVLDQDYYPLTDYTAPSDEYLRTQFQRARHMGINLIRCQSKVPDARYLEWADRIGLIVWYEMPAFGKLNERSQTRARTLLSEALDRDHNHPSLCIVSLIGDGSGVDPRNSEHRTWQRTMYDNAKVLDPTRLIIDNSSAESHHIKTDIEERQGSNKAISTRKDYADWVTNLLNRPGSSFSPLDSSGRRGWEPVILSQQGSWGLPKLSAVRKTYGGDPWWFKASEDASCPMGVEERFLEQGLDNVFGTFDALAEACQWKQWESLKVRIEEMRKRKEIAGYVLGQFTDVASDADGLLDSDRGPKVFYNKVRCVQGADVIIPEVVASNHWAGDRLELDLLVSHFSSRKMDDCRIEWALDYGGLKGEIGAVTAAESEVSRVGTVSLTLPSVDRPRKATLAVKLLSSDGGPIAENYQDLFVFPAAKPAGSRAQVVVSDPENSLADLASRLNSRGYRVSSVLNRRAVVITNRLGEDALSAAASGARVVLLAGGPDSMPDWPGSALAVAARDVFGPWADWSKCFMWLRSAGPMRSVAFEPGAGTAFAEMTPKALITGMDMRGSQQDLFGGIFVGWLHHPSAVAAQFRVGRGKVFVTTLDLRAAYGNDPAATWLLQEIISYVSGRDFSPKTRIEAPSET